MHPFEKFALTVRHSAVLKNADFLWRATRPLYTRLLKIIGKGKLARLFNGTDRVLVPVEFHGHPEAYEPDVWRALMEEVRPGDTVVDVGAAYGLYTVALAKRVGESGHVYAFEPSPGMLRWLRQLIALNGVKARVNVFPHAAGDQDAMITFNGERSTQSHVTHEASDHSIEVRSVKLDTALAGKAVGVMKIDVEGFEEHVLRGADELLSDPRRAPRKIFIEVHPYAWHQFGVSSESLLAFLHDHDYQVFDLQANVVHHITEYGEIVAQRTSSHD